MCYNIFFYNFKVEIDNCTGTFITKPSKLTINDNNFENLTRLELIESDGQTRASALELRNNYYQVLLVSGVREKLWE